MVFSDGWLRNLLRYHNGNFIPCSRLIESGKMPSGLHGMSKNFGNHPSNINFDSWDEWVIENKDSRAFGGGLFMPCVFEKKKFIEAGGYPEGNLFLENDQLVVGYPNDRKVFMSGDQYYFNIVNQKFNMKHITVFDSLVYHIQEGEMDEKNAS